MADDTKKCPYCGEEILAVAKKCKHCGEFLDSAETENIEQTVPRHYTRRNNKNINGWLIAGIILASFVLFGLYTNNTKQKGSETSLNIPDQQQQESTKNSIEETVNETYDDSSECVLELGKTCYYQPFKLNPSEAMTFMECMDKGGSLGIKNCHYEKDYWAGIVKKCGGVNNLPNVDDMRALEEYMYGVKIEKCPFFSDENATYYDVVECWGKYAKLPRNDNLEFVQMMKNMIFPYPPNDRLSYEAQQKWGFSIWTAKEQSGYYSYVGRFGQVGTVIEGDTYRNSDGPWAMCVSRE